MRRFLLFAHQRYYPGGGMCDFVSDHDSVDESKAAEAAWRAVEDDPPYYRPQAHIYDAAARQIVLARRDDGDWEPYDE